MLKTRLLGGMKHRGVINNNHEWYEWETKDKSEYRPKTQGIIDNWDLLIEQYAMSERKE